MSTVCLGIPGRIVDSEQDGGLRVGTVDFAGVRRRVVLGYVPEAAVGDYVIVHVGFAIAVVDAEEASRSYAVLAAMDGALETELGAAPAAGGGR